MTTLDTTIQQRILACLREMRSWEPKWDEEDIFWSACGDILKYAEEQGQEPTAALSASIRSAVRAAIQEYDRVPYYEVISPPHSGMPIVIQEFLNVEGQSPCIGVAGLFFSGEDLQKAKDLGGVQGAGHNGPPDAEVDIAVPAYSSWLFPIEKKHQVIFFVHQTIEQIEAQYTK